MAAMTQPVNTKGWIAITDAAEQLGCHPATLRRRIRSGEVDAVRGPRGRDYIAQSVLKRLLKQPKRGPGRPSQRRWRVEADLVDLAWGWVIGALEHRPADLEYVVSLAENPTRDPAVFRFAIAHALAWEGLPNAQVAEMLGVSDRHVRRLLERDLEYGLSPLVWQRLDRQEQRRRLGNAERRVARLKARLAKDGIRTHISKRYTRLMPYRPTKALVIRPAATPVLVAYLRDAGLSPSDIDAVLLVGLAAEELNELLLRGARR
jgi:AraC-like DNA-binding protein